MQTAGNPAELSGISAIRLTLMGYSALEKGKPDEAARYFDGALDQNPGFAQAAFEMGRLYELGLGVERDLDRAFIYYMMAGEEDQTDAQERLAYFYREGLGTFRSGDQARYWEARAGKIRRAYKESASHRN